MIYSVKYQKPNGIIWHTIKNVEGDTILEHKGQPLPARVFFLADKSRIEIPITHIIRFSKERFYDIQKQMEKEAGQKMSV